MNNIWIYISAVLLLIIGLSTAWMAYVTFRGKTFDEVRVICYKLILKAETTFKTKGSGRLKMDYVFDHVMMELKKRLPSFLAELIDRNMVRDICQAWYDEVKDFLDDGTINGSQKKKMV